MTKPVLPGDFDSPTEFKSGDDPTGDLEKAIANIETKMKEAFDASAKKLADIERKSAERSDALEAKLARPAIIEKKDGEQTIEQKAFDLYLRKGKEALGADEIKTLIVSSEPQGGYLAPPEFSAEFIRNLVEFSPIRSLASGRNTGSPSVIYPKRTAITNAKWKGEIQSAESSEPAFGQVEIVPKTVNTFVDISNQLLADSAGVVEQEVRLALAEDFGKKESVAFISGEAPLAPEGLLKAAGVGYSFTGNASTLGSNPADLLIGHFYSLPATYRNRGTWLMNATVLATIRKLKDSVWALPP